MTMASRIDKRWEQGIDHDPRSVELGSALGRLDEKEGGGCLDLRFGGDGDNGEHLLYLLDLYFEDLDKKSKKQKKSSRRKHVVDCHASGEDAEHCGGPCTCGVKRPEDHEDFTA